MEGVFLTNIKAKKTIFLWHITALLELCAVIIYTEQTEKIFQLDLF